MNKYMQITVIKNQKKQSQLFSHRSIRSDQYNPFSSPKLSKMEQFARDTPFMKKINALGISLTSKSNKKDPKTHRIVYTDCKTMNNLGKESPFDAMLNKTLQKMRNSRKNKPAQFFSPYRITVMPLNQRYNTVQNKETIITNPQQISLPQKHEEDKQSHQKPSVKPISFKIKANTPIFRRQIKTGVVNRIRDRKEFGQPWQTHQNEDERITL